MAIEQILTLKFGKNGTSEHYIGTGWSLAEVGYRWMIGPYSELKMGPVIADSNYILILDIEPFVKPPSLPSQRLTISIDGIPFIQAELSVAGRYGYPIPPELIGHDGEIQIVFDHPDASRPSEVSEDKDYRLLSISVREIGLYRVSGAVDQTAIEGGGGISIDELQARVSMPADQFMTHFESLGENCEFGLVQRRCGAEPLSLLRFSNTLLPNLLRGLHDQFKNINGPDDLGFRLEGKSKKEYIIEEKYYGLVYHTFRYKGEIEEDQFLTNEASRLKFLVRKLREDLADGTKIFIYRRNDALLKEEVVPLAAALNNLGDNTLFWVVPADKQNPPGSVQWLMPGLLKGYIDRFAPNENAHDLSLEIWLELCANAYALWHNRQRPQ